MPDCKNPPRVHPLFYWMILGLIWIAPVRGDIVINEFMASNGTTLPDEEGDFEDWIELYHRGDEPINLGGWGLSDNPSDPFKWSFPEGIEVSPGEHLLVWASGKNRAPGGEITGILREVYFNIPGSEVADLENHPSFPDTPSETQIVTDFFDAPRNIADAYGQRMRGVLIPPQTGDYRFWISSDDASVLRLSSGENPENTDPIASVPDWTFPEEWNKYPSQESKAITLVAGERYYLEALMKEDAGGDHLTLRWERPDGIIEAPIPADYFRTPSSTQFHTSFRIASAGEPLLLTRPDGTHADSVPPVFVPRDVSYGRLGDGGDTWHYFADPTPGLANTAIPAELPPTVTLSEPRGFKNAPFTVTLSADAPDAPIRYTLDGSTPGPDSPLYTEPLEINQTTTLRASAVEPGMIPLPPTTTTWIFLDDVLLQSSDPPPGWPADREVNNHRMEYGMRSQIVDQDGPRLRDGMLDIPSISLVTDLGHLFNPHNGDLSQAGIYSNSNNTHGQERPVSVELIDPGGDPSREFQIDAGLRLRGGFSRSVDNPKHSFRLLFRSAYGENQLHFPLFDEEGSTAFDKVDLRTAQNYSWAFQNSGRNTFLREVFSRDTQRDMGLPHTRSRYYHLYINGQYWGLYMTQERGESDWASTYLGGNSEDWDTVKTSHPGYVTEAADGNLNAFHALHQIAVDEGFSGEHAANYWRVLGRNPDGTPNPAFPKYVDQDNLIHYMLIAHYTGDRDSPVSLFIEPNQPNNMYGLFNRAKPDGFKWLRHDAEHSLGAFSGEGIDWDPTFIGEHITQRDRFNPATLNWRLLEHSEYRMRFADLAQRHLFGNGALTPKNASARILDRKQQIDLAIIGESARWGRGRTRDDDWIPAVNTVLDYIAQRRESLIQFYRNRGWFPSIDAPAARLNGHNVLITSAVPFHYMTDGSDPRLIGGGIHPDALHVSEPMNDGSKAEIIPRGATWHYFDEGTEPPLIDGLDWTHPEYRAEWESGPAVLGFAGVEPTNPVATETRRWVSGDSGPQVTTTYLRHEFTLEHPLSFGNLVMEILRDDGAMIYLNGVEIHRENMPEGLIAYDTEAASVTGRDNQITYFERSLDAAHLLREGQNVLAVSVHQHGATSSDKYFDLELQADTFPYMAEISPARAADTQIRSQHDGEWSALLDIASVLSLPEPALIHQWDFENSQTFPEPSFSLGGRPGIDIEINSAFEPTPAVVLNSSAQGFDTAHLRVNEPLGVTLTWNIPTTGFEGILIDFLSRRSGQGAGEQHWEYTPDGETWIAKETLGVEDADPASYQLDFRSIPAADNNPNFALRVSFSQAGGGVSGNNRFDDFTVTGYPSGAPSPPAALFFETPPIGTATGSILSPIIIRLLDADGNPATAFDGPVTLTLIGDGSLTGTTTVNAVFGTATFDDLILTGTGTFQLTATTVGVPSISTPSFQSLALTTLILPRYIQGEQDDNDDNNDRVPFAWQARIDGLTPNATYRVGNRVVRPDDAPDNNGAGNAILITSPSENWVRNTNAPRFRSADLNTRHLEITADADGSYTGWFITEPSGNARFTPGNTLHMRLLLNNGKGGEDTTHILTTTESAQVLRFGTAPNEGTGIIGETSTAARRIVLLYDETAGTSRPLAATPVEITGSEIDSRYAAFYQSIVATNQSHWGTIIPNDLPNGLRRIETRSLSGDTLPDSRIAPEGFTDTIDPSGGLTTPILLDADAGLPIFLPGGTATWHTPSNWSTASVPNAPAAQAIVNAPATGNRNVNINAPATIGSLRINQADTGFRNRIRDNDPAGTLTFNGGDSQPALLRIEGTDGTGHVDLDFDNPVTLATHLILLVNQIDGDPQQGALRLQQTWTGPGGITKQGPGLASLTGAGKDFIGPLLIEQGALRITGPAVPANTSGVTILPGGQLRLVSSGTREEPRVHTFGGGVIQIGGMGRGGDLPASEQLGVLGALRYDPDSQDNLATLTNPLNLKADTDIHIDGTRNTLRLEGEITANTHTLIKTGGGTLEIAADSTDAPAIDVKTGTLAVTAAYPAAITLTENTTLTGNGTLTTLTGQGTVDPGDQTLTATTSAAANYAFLFTETTTGTLSLTALTEAPENIDIHLDVASLVPGTTFQGGLLLPTAYTLSESTTLNLLIAEEDAPVTYRGQTYRVATEEDNLTWSIVETPEGYLIEVAVAPQLSGFAHWQLEHFTTEELADSDISGPSATPPGRVGANLLRYAIGLAPDEPLPQIPTLTADLRLRFPVHLEKIDIIYRIKASYDLLTWTETLYQSNQPDAPAPQDGWLEIPIPSAPPKIFLRLEIQPSED